MATRDPNNPDTTEAVQAKAWLRIGDFLQEANYLIHDLMILWTDEDDPMRQRCQHWLDEYDAHQIPQQETPQ